MKIKGALIAATILGLTPALATQAQQSYKAANWEEAVNEVPCAAFKKNANGSWTIPTLTLGNGSGTMSSVSLIAGANSYALSPDASDTAITNLMIKGGKDAAILDQRCGSTR